MKLWWGKDGVLHNIGDPAGVPQEVMDKCMARLAGWVHLSICVIKQEYPDFGLVSCFGMLSLSK